MAASCSPRPYSISPLSRCAPPGTDIEPPLNPGRPDTTQRHFPPNPFATNRGSTPTKTGLARWLTRSGLSTSPACRSWGTCRSPTVRGPPRETPPTRRGRWAASHHWHPNRAGSGHAIKLRAPRCPQPDISGLLARSRPGAVSTRDRTAEVSGQDRGSKAVTGRAGQVARRTFPPFGYKTAPGIGARPDRGSTAA